MAYPFAENRFAQSGSHDYQGYNDPYTSHQPAATQFNTTDRYHQEGPPYSGQGLTDSYEYEPSMVARDAQRGNDSSYQTYPNNNSTNLGDDDLHEEKAVGRSPYETAPEMYAASPYAGNSIWTYDDKRVMAKRSVPARIFRVLFCTIINTIIIIISIVCLVVIFARPPNVGIGAINYPNASSVGVSGSALTINGSVDFIVSNPNSISVTLSSLVANIYDKVDESQSIGSANIEDKKIDAHTNTTINFPYQIKYDPNGDTSKTIIKDLATKCGLTGGSAETLDLVLKVTSKISVLSVPIPVSFNQDISFTCPLSADVLKSIGITNISGLFRRAFQKRWFDFFADFSDREEL